MAALSSRVLGTLLGVAALGIAGCDLFKPAEPEPPIGQVIAGNYTDVDSTLATLATAVRAKGQLDGGNAYLKGFADPALDGRGFVAEFDPATLSRYSGAVPDPWRREEESNFYSRFAASDGTLAHDMQWKDGDQDDPTPTDSIAVVYRQYKVFRLSANNSVSTVALGQAEMTFYRSTRGWVMTKWVDREEPNPPTGVVSYGLLRLNNQ